jgi:hypothetical protein
MQTFTNSELVYSLILIHAATPSQKIESHRVIYYMY